MAGIDEVLERLVAEPEFREQLRADPAAALSGYVLDDEDLEMLAATLDESAGGDHDVEQRTSKSALLGLVVGLAGAGGGGGAPDADLSETSGKRNDGFTYSEITWSWNDGGLSGEGPDDVLAAADGVPIEPVAIQNQAASKGNVEYEWKVEEGEPAPPGQDETLTHELGGRGPMGGGPGAAQEPAEQGPDDGPDTRGDGPPGEPPLDTEPGRGDERPRDEEPPRDDDGGASWEPTDDDPGTGREPEDGPGDGPDDVLTGFEDTKGDTSGSEGGSAGPGDTTGAEGLVVSEDTGTAEEASGARSSKPKEIVVVGSKGESPDGDPDQLTTDPTDEEPPDDDASAIDSAETQDSWETIP